VVALALVAAPAAQAQGDSPGRDQYIPSIPTAPGNGEKQKNANQSSNSSGSADDQALDQITGGQSSGSSNGGSQQNGDKSGSKKSDKKKKSSSSKPQEEDASGVVPLPVGSGGDDDDDEGALTSATNALTDWDEPLVPGLVALAALLTLGLSIVVLVRRRRSPGSGI
jgi:hypothetical protein